MSYELRHGEALGENLRRICRNQIEGAIATAKGGETHGGSPVHETRKHLKKARAALQLVRQEIGRSLFREQNSTLRDIARLISDVRDAEVRLQTVQQLQRLKSGRHRAYDKIETLLLMELENFMAAFAEWQSEAIPKLEDACSGIDCWPLDHFDCAQLRHAVQRTYKRARRALAKANADRTAENFHQFRSRAKMLWYQLRILRPVNAVVLKTLGDEIGSLAAVLGRAHDLHFLGARLRDEQDETPWQSEGRKLLPLIEVSEMDLQRGAADLAERFFAERPRVFGERIAQWLEEWTGNSSASVAAQLV